MKSEFNDIAGKFNVSRSDVRTLKTEHVVLPLLLASITKYPCLRRGNTAHRSHGNLVSQRHRRCYKALEVYHQSPPIDASCVSLLVSRFGHMTRRNRQAGIARYSLGDDVGRQCVLHLIEEQLEGRHGVAAAVEEKVARLEREING